MWVSGIRKVHHPERVDLEESHNVNKVAVEARRMELLAGAKFQFSQLGDAARSNRTRIWQEKGFQLGDGPTASRPPPIFGDGGEHGIGVVELEFIPHLAGRAQ